MRRIELTEIASADLKSIRRYSLRTWGPDRTAQYMTALRDTMKGLLAGTVVSRDRDDLRPRLKMAASGATVCSSKPTHHASLSFACFTTRWTICVTSKLPPALTRTGESVQAARLSSSTAFSQGTHEVPTAGHQGRRSIW